MGHTYRNNGQITDFEPDNDENALYLYGDNIDLEYLMESIKEYFGDNDLSKYSISAEHIHTSCLGYDLYDSSDYSNYIVIHKN
jgi:hypothetical protein